MSAIFRNADAPSRELVRRFVIALTSAPRRSAEEYVTEDWTAVANAINQRMVALGMSQRELVARSHVSKAIVSEIRNNTVQRRRSDRTLEALSIALDWHPGYLTAVLAGRRTPEPGEPLIRSDDDVPARLTLIEQQLRDISAKLADLDAIDERLAEISDGVTSIAKDVAQQRDSRDS